MLIKQLIIGSSMVLVTASLHVVALFFLAVRSRRILIDSTWSENYLKRLVILSLLVLAVVAIHSVGVWLWAFFYLAIGEFSEFGRALYFSATTITTLGYGDITLSPDWQLTSTFEALSGLILIGVSTAFMFEMMRHVLDDAT